MTAEVRAEPPPRVWWQAFGVMATVFLVFRLPALLNPGFINSDGAVTGLQARAMLGGEWEPLHWGRDYLTSVDSVMAVPFFAIFGARPETLVTLTVFAQLVLTGLVFSVIARRVGPWAALVMLASCLFMTLGTSIYLFFGVRQWSLCLSMLAVVLIDRGDKRVWLLAVGPIVAFLATFADLFNVQILPGLVLFAVLQVFSYEGWKARLKALGFVVAGLGGGAGAMLGLRVLTHVNTIRAQTSFNLLERNWGYMKQAVPFLMGSKPYGLTATGGAAAIHLPASLSPVHFLAGVVCVVALVSPLVLFFVRRIPWNVRIVGVAGSAFAVTSLTGFLFSHAVEDVWAARLLTPVVVGLPLALVPLGWLFESPGRVLLLMWSYVLTTFIGGWLGWGAGTTNGLPKQTPYGAMTFERAAARALTEQGVHYAMADYWVSYRMSFIADVDLSVVPYNARDDRYAKWRAAFTAAPKVGFVINPEFPFRVQDPRLVSVSGDFGGLGLFVLQQH